MMKTRATRRGRALALVAVLGLVGAACGSDGDDDSAPADAPAETSADAPAETSADAPADSGGDPVTIEWWHIANNDPGLSAFQDMADAYMAENPNVTVNITVLENEAFKAAIQTNMQAGDVPDVFQTWGGGVLRQQMDAGLVQDITAATSEWIGDLGPGAVSLFQLDGKQYGVPYQAGMVGFWYNKDLFEEAGVTEVPTTWDGLLTTVQQIKDAGITPIAVGAGDKWPAHFWYSYLMVRLCGADTMTAMAADGDFSRQCVLDAGQKVLDLVALEPFQDGYLGTPWTGPDGEDGTMAVEGAAMDLMGQWAPGAFRAQLGLTEVDDVLPWNIGWFPFPSVEGQAGADTDAFGGGDGFAVGKDAPPEAIDFLHFILNEENQETWAASGNLPANLAAQDAVTDVNMKAVLDGLNNATFMQLYLDQFLTPEIAGQVGDQTALLFGDATTPADAAAAITATATGG